MSSRALQIIPRTPRPLFHTLPFFITCPTRESATITPALPFFTLDVAMIEATRRWLRRNRTNLLIGAGVLGAGYLAGQYVIGKIQEARQRISEDRIAKEKCV